ncbi:U5 snRNP-specific subunit [Theileria orientalis]|uniref:U5 snRNP-specific subunit n=1 Tax=Theileria orientalis TaxID=68886 RepID=A0A976SL50_THEOR|nr:U5 snRNP-specific subunit [Theileria orientalis]
MAINPVEEEERENVLNFPVMLLTGHESEVYSLDFSQDGRYLASSGKDRQILLFEAFGECRNFGVLAGHKNAVLEIHWAQTSNYLYSCSADSTASVWDVVYNRRLRKLKGHSGIVNTCAPARNYSGGLLVTGSDDGTVKVWDSRQKGYSNSISHDFQILAVTTDPDFNYIYSGSLDNVIRVYDVRNESNIVFELGCLDSITSLDLNSDSTLLLSNSMDERLNIWDVQPFSSKLSHEDGLSNGTSSTTGKGADRLRMTLTGPTHNNEKNLIKSHWGRNSIICSGSSDQFVYVFDTVDQKLLYQLPGHLGTVNDVQLHPSYPIVASCSNDRTIYLGEL